MKTVGSKLRQRVPSARLVLCLFLVVVIAGIPTTPAQAAGLYTHTWFVERAIQMLNAQGGRYTELVGILNRHAATVNYGALFPDVTMTNDSDWAEIAHDTTGARANYAEYLTFLTAKGYDKFNSSLQAAYYKQYLRDPAYHAKIPQFRQALFTQMIGHFTKWPRSDNDERMIAFLFGVIAHQEADTPWHLNAPGCDDSHFWGIGWGTQCAAIKDKGYLADTVELSLDWILYHYDNPEHTVDFGFLNSVDPVVYSAIDAAGIRRPWYNVTCLLETDPLKCGEPRLEALWGTATSDLGANDGMRDWLETYVPGGIEYGSALVAGAWMDTWDRFAPAAPELPTGVYRSLQSHNYPDRYMRHRNWLLKVESITSDLARKDATFRIAAGLAGTSCISFESLNYPNYYLHDRGAGVEANLALFEDTPAFRAAATFCVRHGLADPNKFSFESYGEPGKYLRHRDSWLWVEYENTNLFHADATYSVVTPLGLKPLYLPAVLK